MIRTIVRAIVLALFVGDCLAASLSCECLLTNISCTFVEVSNGGLIPSFRYTGDPVTCSGTCWEPSDPALSACGGIEDCFGGGDGGGTMNASVSAREQLPRRSVVQANTQRKERHAAGQQKGGRIW